MVNTWRTTDNAIESLAQERNDSILILDELGQVSPLTAGDIAYTLGNGQQKARANRFGHVRPIANWRLLFISTGEIGLAEHVAQGGGKARAGQEIRMLDIPSDAGKGMGVFEKLHGAPTPQAFADSIEELARVNYGTAAEALLTLLTSSEAKRNEAVTQILQHRQAFVSKYVPVNAHGQVFRAATRFGLIAGVGEFCIREGVLPWEPGESEQSAKQCYFAWLNERGGEQAQEEIRALEQVRRFLELHGESRFTLLEPIGIEDNRGQRTINRAGFRKVMDDGAIQYWVLPEVYKAEICIGFDPKLVTKVLVQRGFMSISLQGKAQIMKRLPGFSNATRVYVITTKIFDESGSQNDRNSSEDTVSRTN